MHPPRYEDTPNDRSDLDKRYCPQAHRDRCPTHSGRESVSPYRKPVHDATGVSPKILDISTILGLTHRPRLIQVAVGKRISHGAFVETKTDTARLDAAQSHPTLPREDAT